MGENRWKKDNTPYFIFSCFKCKNYSLVKTTQKGKKCLRCGHYHHVSQLESNSEVVKGATAARMKLIEKQNFLAKKELGSDPDLIAEGGFSVSNGYKENQISNNQKQARSSFDIFNKLLLKLDFKFKQFPEYVIYMIAEEQGIPRGKVKKMIDRCMREHILEKQDALYELIKK